MELEEKQGKYSLVTGEKIKKKSVRKLKKEHKKAKKEENKESKKQNKKKVKIDKKLQGETVLFKSKTVSGDVEGDTNSLEITKNGLVEDKEKVLIVRKADKEKPISKKRKLFNLISYFLVGFVAVFFGYIAGNFYVANFMNKVDYSAFTEENLIATNAQEIYNKAKQDGVMQTSAIDLFVAAEYYLNNRDKYNSSIKGEIQPSIGSVQSIWGTKNKNGNIFEVESVSKGMLALGEKYTYDLTNQTATIYKASSIDTNKATYPDNPTWVMTYDEFREEYGTAPEKPCIPYIISSKTLVEGSGNVIQEGVGKYKITFMLTTDSSVINYIKQVKHMSGLKDYPTFKNIMITAYINDDLEFLDIRFDESYTVMYFGVMATCSGFVEVNFSY